MWKIGCLLLVWLRISKRLGHLRARVSQDFFGSVRHWVWIRTIRLILTASGTRRFRLYWWPLPHLLQEYHRENRRYRNWAKKSCNTFSYYFLSIPITYCDSFVYFYHCLFYFTFFFSIMQLHISSFSKHFSWKLVSQLLRTLISLTNFNRFLYFFLFLKVPNIIRATVIPI